MAWKKKLIILTCPKKVFRRFEAATPSLSVRSCLRTSWAALRESGCKTFSCFCDGFDALVVLEGAILDALTSSGVRVPMSESRLEMSRREGPGDQQQQRANSAQQTLDILYDISRLLNTQLDKETLATCVGMIESGVNPEALAAVVQELRRENAALPR